MGKIKKPLDEIAPWGKTYGRTSKNDYRNIVLNQAMKIQELQYIVYIRDLLYNPCHEIWMEEEKSKGLNKPKS